MKMSWGRLPSILGTCALAACSVRGALPAWTGVQPSSLRTSIRNAIPPRLQWMGNFGYCGEVSLISAGLYYGQYVSQYTARAIASRGTPQYLRRSQLLLGVNDAYAARRMHLRPVEWNTAAQRSTDQFLTWIRRNVALGRPVAIGLYTNEYRFYGNTNAHAGDPAYDHIVPVVAMTPQRLTFSDNGLWGPPRPYLFDYALATIARSRTEANRRTAPPYSLAADGKNYGIAISGVADPAGETLPVRVATSVNYERPAIVNGTSVRPRAVPIVLTVTVSGLRPGLAYNLYRYGDFASVPERRFNARAGAASKRWPIVITSGSTYAVRETIMSDAIAVYRAVSASGP